MRVRLPVWDSGPCAELNARVAEKGFRLRQEQ
jgi:hypothetical protein